MGRILEADGVVRSAARRGLGLTLLAAFLFLSTAAAETEVDMELILAIDASGSVDAREYALQLSGIAAAFRDPEVLSVLGQGYHGRIGVALVTWAETGHPPDASPWLVVGDRATTTVAGKPLPIDEIVESTAHQWLQEHLRFVDPREHVVIQNELRPGSTELVGIFAPQQAAGAGRYRANDTSAAVGFAPLTETEHLVLAAEHFLNSAPFKHEFPETGEDVKVMGVRRGRRLYLTVAMAYVDHHIWEEATYFHRKTAARRQLEQLLESKLHRLDGIDIELNMLDRPGQGLDGMYLTVLGTSAEGADGGEVGRGNRANGLISLCRPMTMEAAAGKNPVSHVGKIYNLLAPQIAATIYESIDAVEEATVWLCSQIGRPIDQPWFTSVQLAVAAGTTIGDVQQPVATLVQESLANIAPHIQQLIRGELQVC